MSTIKSSYSFTDKVYAKLERMAEKKGVAKSVVLTLAINDMYNKEYPNEFENTSPV